MFAEKNERRKNLQEIRSTQIASDAYHQPLEATIGEHHLSQQDRMIVHTVDSTHAEAMGRASAVHQLETHTQLHIYDNTSVHSE